MKICVAGQGAFGQKHLDALKRIAGVEVTSLVGGNQETTAAVAKKYGVPHFTGDLAEGIKRADAVILMTPTKMHFQQGEQVSPISPGVPSTASRNTGSTMEKSGCSITAGDRPGRERRET